MDSMVEGVDMAAGTGMGAVGMDGMGRVVLALGLEAGDG
jgi:hypothetical protein